jgi:tetratricopeptide (TPR) repeat protein
MFDRPMILATQMLVALLLTTGETRAVEAQSNFCPAFDRHGYSTAAPKFSLAADPRSSSDDAAARCTTEQLELDSKSVEAPCDARLADRSLSDRERADALYVRARGYYRTRRPGLAGDDYEAAIALDPKNADFRVSHGWLMHSISLHAAAVSDALDALTLDPKNARALDLMGFLKWWEGDRERAVDHYSQALSIAPSLITARYHRAKLLFDLGRYREALPDADLLVALSPEAASHAGLFDSSTMRKANIHADALLLRARIHDGLENFAASEGDFKASLALDRNGDVLTWYGALLQREPDRRQEGIAYLREAISLTPNDFLPHFYYGLALTADKYFDDAIEQYGTSIRLCPSCSRAYLERALARKALGQTERAVQDLEIAMWSDRYSFDLIMSNLKVTHYWPKAEDPEGSSKELRDSLTACVIDPHCI